MISLFLVFCAFALMFLSDALKLRRHTGAGKLFFWVGMLTLAAAGIFAALSGTRFFVAPLIKALLLFASAIGAWGVYTSLFSSLPVRSTYLGQEEATQLVNSGMYALCRHPGALWFPVFTIFLALGLANLTMLMNAALASLLNILYVWYQDVMVFPKTIHDYDDYRKTTPFLLPSAKSLTLALGKKPTKQVN